MLPEPDQTVPDDDTDDQPEVELDVPQAPLDTDPDDELVTDDADQWPYDPETESVPDEEVAQ
jgi:hypothetical protein